MISILVSFALIAVAEDLPRWIKQGSLSDSKGNYVICSYDGLDPEEARQIAESKCLTSAAKLNGVNVKLSQKTIQSLTGTDSSEIAEIQPIDVNIKCEWTDRYLQTIKDGYRVWLRCKVLKNQIISKTETVKGGNEIKAATYNNLVATVLLSTIPTPDRIVIVGKGGERVIEPKSNSLSILISGNDEKIEISKLGYKKVVINLPIAISHGSKLIKTVILEKD